jgi:hypothetical protein
MGEIADMMLDGTMDSETGEWNFEGEDGPGFPMTGAEAAAYRRATGWRGQASFWSGETAYKLTKHWRKKLEAFGTIKANDRFHWQIRRDGKIVADWWPHKNKWRIDDKNHKGDVAAFATMLSAQPREGAKP